MPILRLAAVALGGLLAAGGVLQALMPDERTTPVKLLPGVPYVVETADDSAE